MRFRFSYFKNIFICFIAIFGYSILSMDTVQKMIYYVQNTQCRLKYVVHSRFKQTTNE